MLTVTTVFHLYAVILSVSLSWLLQLFLPFLNLYFLGFPVLLSHCPCPSHGSIFSMSSWCLGVNHLHAGRRICWFLKQVCLLTPPNLKTSLCCEGRGLGLLFLHSKDLVLCPTAAMVPCIRMGGLAHLVLLLLPCKPQLFWSLQSSQAKRNGLQTWRKLLLQFSGRLSLRTIPTSSTFLYLTHYPFERPVCRLQQDRLACGFFWSQSVSPWTLARLEEMASLSSSHRLTPLALVSLLPSSEGGWAPSLPYWISQTGVMWVHLLSSYCSFHSDVYSSQRKGLLCKLCSSIATTGQMTS